MEKEQSVERDAKSDVNLNIEKTHCDKIMRSQYTHKFHYYVEKWIIFFVSSVYATVAVFTNN